MSNLKIAKQIPFNVLIKRILKKAWVKKPNYHVVDNRMTRTDLSIATLLSPNFTVNDLSDKCNNYCNHQFDLLGSGWGSRNVQINKEVNAIHHDKTERIAKNIDVDYGKINWQLDIKTNFEFDATKPYYEQTKPTGVDIKDCWELGRLQHLPQLALAAINSEEKYRYIREFKNQCLDFIAYNPIGMGVQWACAMDVGIRVANLLMAYDIFSQIDEKAVLDDQFKLVVADSIYQHGVFIFNHLEHKEGAAGNHYLFNLIGLLFAATYLSKNEEISSWFSFASNELKKEFHKQFFDDGGNFEGSITYHCLSVEAVLYGTALILRNNDSLSKEYTDLLFKAANFIKDMTKPNGEVPQFGDNDSGRLFKLVNEDENLLNYESLLAAFSGLYENSFDVLAKKYTVHKNIIEQLSGGNKISSKKCSEATMTDIQFSSYEYSETTEINFTEVINLQQLKSIFYPEFGLYGFKTEKFYLAISAIANSKMHHSWGHVHNDKLSFELQVNDVDLVKDAGSYLYTSDPKQRNLFRSGEAHHGIVVKGVEQNKMIDLFYLDREVKCSLLAFTETSITLKASYYSIHHVRKFEIFEGKLKITDTCNKPFDVNINSFDTYSPNYGVKQ